MFTYLVWMINLSLVDQITDITKRKEKKPDTDRIAFPILCYINFHISIVIEVSQLPVVLLCFRYRAMKTLLYDLDTKTRYIYTCRHP